MELDGEDIGILFVCYTLYNFAVIRPGRHIEYRCKLMNSLVMAAVDNGLHLSRNLYCLSEEHVTGESHRVHVDAHEVLVIPYILPVVPVQVGPVYKHMGLRFCAFVDLCGNILPEGPACCDVHRLQPETEACHHVVRVLLKKRFIGCVACTAKQVKEEADLKIVSAGVGCF